MTYDYRCPKCKLEVEIEESITQHGHVAHICSECGELLESIIKGPRTVVLQGPGWYKDGYKSHGVIGKEK